MIDDMLTTDMGKSTPFGKASRSREAETGTALNDSSGYSNRVVSTWVISTVKAITAATNSHSPD
jgi:hypothetical protein